MALAVSRPYACPACQESFTKWGLCQNHLRASEPCRSAFEDKLDDTAVLQELCRSAAGTNVAKWNAGSAEPQTPLQVQLPTSAGAAGAPGACGAIGAGAPEDREVADDVFAYEDRKLEHQINAVAPSIRRRLDRAVQGGLLTDVERLDLEDKFEDLAEHPHEIQLAAVRKLFSIGSVRLRWVSDKGSWLLRCLRFCLRTIHVEPAGSMHGSNAALISALAHHALMPDALSQECWDMYSELPNDIRTHVVTAVRGSILANLMGKLSEHFANIVCNEQVIAFFNELPPPRLHPSPEAQEMDAIDGTLYHRLLQQFLMRQRTCEERLFKELADASPDVQPGDEGSIFHTHMATEAARMNGSAEVLSLLHVAAAHGFARAAARFIAEGLDANEKTGVEQVTPLHCAAAKGEVDVVDMLLREEADPNIRDDHGHTALYITVREAAEQKKAERDRGSVRTSSDSQYRKLVIMLLDAGAENVVEGEFTPEALAEAHELCGIRNTIRLHTRIRKLQDRLDIDEAPLEELHKLQYETASFAIGLFERHLQLKKDAASVELSAFVASDFIQSRDKVQRLGNRLANHVNLQKKALDALMDLPPSAGLHVLNTWKIEETVPGIYEVPDHLNLPPKPEPSAAPVEPPGEGDSGTNDNCSEQGASEAVKALEGVGIPEGQTVSRAAVAKLQGRIRKWDSERGFGFIVQDSKEGEEVIKDIFVHRTNVIGSNPANHIDLKENSRVAYRLGEQDGRLRASEVTMIDGNGRPLSIHLGAGACQADMPGNANNEGRPDDDNDIDEEGEFTNRFIRYIRTKEVQDVVQKERVQGEPWLRCLGLRRHNVGGRRDDSVWRKEIDRRVDVLVERGTTPLQKKDFDFRVRRFLHEHSIHSNVSKVSELLAMVEASTQGKSRDEVRSWPAYLATLLRRIDHKLYEVLADRDRRSREDQRNGRHSGEGVRNNQARSVSRRIDDEPQDESDNGDEVEAGEASPPPDYSDGSIEDPSTGDSSSLQSTPREQGEQVGPGGEASLPPEAPPRRVFQ